MNWLLSVISLQMLPKSTPIYHIHSNILTSGTLLQLPSYSVFREDLDSEQIPEQSHSRDTMVFYQVQPIGHCTKLIISMACESVRQRHYKHLTYRKESLGKAAACYTCL